MTLQHSYLIVFIANAWGMHHLINTLRPRQNGRLSADDAFKRIFLHENVTISIKISLKFVPKCPINDIPALVQIMAWRRSGDKPLSEQMMVSWLTHICVTRPQWVNMAARQLTDVITCFHRIIRGSDCKITLPRTSSTGWNEMTTCRLEKWNKVS